MFKLLTIICISIETETYQKYKLSRLLTSYLFLLFLIRFGKIVKSNIINLSLFTNIYSNANILT